MPKSKKEQKVVSESRHNTLADQGNKRTSEAPHKAGGRTLHHASMVISDKTKMNHVKSKDKRNSTAATHGSDHTNSINKDSDKRSSNSDHLSVDDYSSLFHNKVKRSLDEDEDEEENGKTKKKEKEFHGLPEALGILIALKNKSKFLAWISGLSFMVQNFLHIDLLFHRAL